MCFIINYNKMIKNTSKNGEYVSILITMKQQQFRNYNARYIEDTMMSILETWTLNDFAENQETLFNIMRVFLSGMNASPQTLN